MNRLKELREERNLSFRKVDELIGINYMTLNHYENETRDINTRALKKLASFYEVSIDYLLCNSDYYVLLNYKESKTKYITRKSIYNYLIKNGFIYFESNKRYIDFNKMLGIDDQYDISIIINDIYSSIIFKNITSPKTTLSELNNILNPDEIEINEILLKNIIESLSIIKSI